MPVGYVGVVCGIFIKKIRLQPEVLDEYLDDVDKPDLPNKLTDDDELGFEDETQRTVITGITIGKETSPKTISRNHFRKSQKLPLVSQSLSSLTKCPAFLHFIWTSSCG